MKNERIKIIADLKNVPEVFIHIYEFNSENYYLKTMEPFKTNVDLEGLVSQHELMFTFNQDPRLKFRETFEFP